MGNLRFSIVATVAAILLTDRVTKDYLLMSICL